MRIAAALAVLGLLAIPSGATSAEPISAERLERLLKEQRLVKLEDRRVTGDLELPTPVALDARDVTFEGRVVGVEEEDSVDRPSVLILTGSSFEQPVTIARRHLTAFDCTGCTFEKDADFHSNLVAPARKDQTEIHRSGDAGSLLLEGAEFHSFADISAARITGQLRLVDTRFDDAATFAATRIGTFESARIRSRRPIVIGWWQFGDEWEKRSRNQIAAIDDDNRREAQADQHEQELRFWRRNFKDLGIDEDARQANYALVKLRRDVSFPSPDPDAWVPYLLALPSGYGTSPYRPVWISVVAVTIFFLLFGLIGFRDKEDPTTVMKKRNGWPYAVAYSVQTFVPFLSIPGIKDDDWELRRARALVPISGVFGAVLFGLAAYSAAISL